LNLVALISCIVLSTASLAWGFSQAGWVVFSRWLLAIGLGWLLAAWRRWNWFPSVGLFAAVIAASIGFWFELHEGWMIAGAMLALFAWDLSEFRQRLRFAARDDDLPGLERRHIARLSLVVMTGMILTSISLAVRVKFTFEWTVFLVLLALLGLSQLTAWFGKG
jgi:hypothetical protein